MKVYVVTRSDGWHQGPVLAIFSHLWPAEEYVEKEKAKDSIDEWFYDIEETEVQ